MRIRRPVLRADGTEVKLTKFELADARAMEREINSSPRFRNQFSKYGIAPVSNSLGYQVDITTLTTILKQISEQKFYTVPFADYLPVRVGEGAWSQFLTGYRSFQGADEFETGILNTGTNNTRLAQVVASVDSITTQVYNWAKSIEWTIMDIYQASRAGNWDYISELEKSRKENWDLGVQRIAFLGANGQNGAQGQCLGLLNQPIAPNTTLITEAISGMDATEFNNFVKAAVNAYRQRTNRTAYPSAFIMPESDFLGLASQMSTTFPLRTKISLLMEAFQLTTGNKQFKILPLAYADAEYHEGVNGIDGKQVYTFLNYDERSLRMDIPVQYSNTMQNTLNGFSFQSAGFGQFTGVQLYRPLELMYFTYTPS